MKIAVSSSGNDLDAQIDPRFGRCAFFLIVDADAMTFEAYDNQNMALGGGAGIQSAQFVASKGTKVVITGNCGPNAVRALAAAGIEIVMGQSGKVRDAVTSYRQGKLSAGSEPNVPDHYGAAASTPGAGRGRAMGGGRCRRWPWNDAENPGASGRALDDAHEDTLDGLKVRAEALKKEIEALEARIRSAKEECRKAPSK